MLKNERNTNKFYKKIFPASKRQFSDLKNIVNDNISKQEQYNESKEQSDNELHDKINEIIVKEKSIEFLNHNIENEVSEIKKLMKEKETHRKLDRNYVELKYGRLLNDGITFDQRDVPIVIIVKGVSRNIYDMHLMLLSLFEQTIKPDRVILMLDEKDFNNGYDSIPKKIIDLKKVGLEIELIKDGVCEIHSYIDRELNNSIIVVANDNVYYHSEWLNQLYSRYLDKEGVICYSADKINLSDNVIQPYSQFIENAHFDEFSSFYIPNLNGGILFPPDVITTVLNQVTEDIDLLYPKLDVYMWGMLVLNKCKVYMCNRNVKEYQYYNNELLYVDFEREFGLVEIDESFANSSVLSFEKDIQIEKLIDRYPQINQVLINEQNPDISVIVPVHNSSKYLATCLRSILNQTSKNIEIICVENGSTDKSMDLLDIFKSRDSRIVIVQLDESSPSKARTEGMKLARGEYIGFVDSDDFVDNDYFTKLYRLAKQQNADMVRGAYKEVSEDNITEARFNKILEESIRKKRMLGPNDHCVVIWNAIYKTSYLRENKIDYFDDLNSSEDVVFTARATLCSRRTVASNGTYYYYKLDHSNNQVSKLNIKAIDNMLTSNILTLKVINSYKFISNRDYMIAFSRCIARFDVYFKKAMKLEGFNATKQLEYFKVFHEELRKCKYMEKLPAFLNTSNLDSVINNNFDKYLKGIKK